MKTFKNWLISEGKDLFGFERDSAEPKRKVEDESPITPISADIILEYLHSRDIDGHKCFSDSHDHVQWGRHPGAVQMVISPLGSFKSIIRKLQVDLLGEQVWVCKEIVPYKEILKATVKLDEDVAEDIFEKLSAHWKCDVEAPSGDYAGLEHLTIKVAEACRRKDVIPELFVYRGVRMMDRNRRYNIHFELAGQGVEAPGSSRVEQFSIDMVYEKDSGMIRSFGYDIQSPTKGHVWRPQPSEWDEKFSPSQDENQIVAAICAALSTY